MSFIKLQRSAMVIPPLRTGPRQLERDIIRVRHRTERSGF